MNKEKVVIGIDAYNQSVTGGVSKPLTHIATDSDHIPLVLVVEYEYNNKFEQRGFSKQDNP